jgi:molecular chaperone GrpE
MSEDRTNTQNTVEPAETQPVTDTARPEPTPAQVEAPARSDLTQEEIEALKAKAAKADENWDRLLRTAADFENYKKRVAREREDLRKYAVENLMRKLAPVLDGFDMALAAVNANASAESLKTGIAMVHSQLKSALAEAGLEEIDAIGQAFDPRWQEAVGHEESAEVPEGHVVQQLRKGYRLHDRLLRPASVVVAKKPTR